MREDLHFEHCNSPKIPLSCIINDFTALAHHLDGYYVAYKAITLSCILFVH